MRLHLEAVVGQGRHGLRHLQHGKAVVALTNAQRNRLARVPTLLLWLFVGGSLPLGRRQHAFGFAHDVNARELAKSQGLHLLADQVNAHVARQRVVVGVARFDNGLVHVHRAVTAFFVVAKTVIAKLKKSRIKDDGFFCPLARLQGSQRHERFVRRSWRVGATQSAVEQGLVNRFVQSLPVVGIDAVHKQVGVKRGLADEGQDFTGFGIERNQGTTASAVQVFHQFL